MHDTVGSPLSHYLPGSAYFGLMRWEYEANSVVLQSSERRRANR